MIASAFQIDLKDGSRIWVPPRGRPFWAHLTGTPSLTDEEMREFNIPTNTYESLTESLKQHEGAVWA